MKKITITILRNAGRVLGVLSLCLFAAAGTAFADNSISKTFEFGPGTPYTRSNIRSFSIPCGLAIAAVVKFRRDGGSSTANDIPIKIELISPESGGPIDDDENAFARTSEQTVILKNHGFSTLKKGCSTPWQVRVRTFDEEPAPLRTYGTIRLDYDGREKTLVSESGKSLKKGSSLTIEFGPRAIVRQGRIEITGSWNHVIGGVTLGPNPVKLKFQLIGPDGTVVKTAEGYSSNEFRSELPKLKLFHVFGDCDFADWKLKITNVSNDDAGDINPKILFTPDCL